mmetsp:Transcript_72971/g.171154  ORF Transcript_72971/g.171154 Transcript_72971/m.171154 type:complete len:225 (+) Transcript_72971:94-768(+)
MILSMKLPRPCCTKEMHATVFGVDLHAGTQEGTRFFVLLHVGVALQPLQKVFLGHDLGLCAAGETEARRDLARILVGNVNLYQVCRVNRDDLSSRLAAWGFLMLTHLFQDVRVGRDPLFELDQDAGPSPLCTMAFGLLDDPLFVLLHAKSPVLSLQANRSHHFDADFPVGISQFLLANSADVAKEQRRDLVTRGLHPFVEVVADHAPGGALVFSFGQLHRLHST